MKVFQNYCDGVHEHVMQKLYYIILSIQIYCNIVINYNYLHVKRSSCVIHKCLQKGNKDIDASINTFITSLN